MSRTALLLTYRTHAGKRDVYHQVFERIVRPRVEANPGIELLFRCNDDDDPGAIHLFELYAERAVLDEVENASWLADYNTAIEPILADPMEFTFASPVWTKETDPLAVDMTSDPPPLGLFVQYRTRGGGRGAIRAAWEERVKPHIEASDAIRFFFWCGGMTRMCFASSSSIRIAVSWTLLARRSGSRPTVRSSSLTSLSEL